METEMTARELIERLQRMPPDTEVMFSYTESDYCQTETANPIEAVRTDAVVADSRFGFAVSDDSDDDDLNDDTRRLVVLLK